MADPSAPVLVGTPAPAPQSPSAALRDAVGNPTPPPDVAWVAPQAATAAEIRAQSGAVQREIPLVSVATGWDVAATRSAYQDLVIGIFDRPAQLVDSIAGDSRVQAAMASRVGGILGRPVTFQVPAALKSSPAAKECRDAFRESWPTMGAEPILSEIQSWAVQLGFGPAQLLWDTSGRYAIPHLRPWHPRFTYYHWQYRCYVAITMDGQTPIIGGDGHWLLHAPHGEYRGWMRGAVRAIAPWWLARNYALRDWARYSERHGLPMIKAKTPAMGDPIQINNWRNSLANLGQETVISCPQGVSDGTSFDLDLMEASDGAWEGFAGLIRQCDTEITLSLLAQNLTTEVREGSFAAARVHADVRQALLEADARALSDTIYNQIARPFAAMNFGDPDLAPRVIWSVKPYEDDKTAADTFKTFADALLVLREGGIMPKDVNRLALSFGLDIGKLTTVEPLQVTVSAARGRESKGFDATKAAPLIQLAASVGLQPSADGVAAVMAASGLGSEPLEEKKATVRVELDPTDAAKVVTVDEGRVSQGLEPLGDDRLISELATAGTPMPGEPMPENDD